MFSYCFPFHRILDPAAYEQDCVRLLGRVGAGPRGGWVGGGGGGSGEGKRRRGDWGGGVRTGEGAWGLGRRRRDWGGGAGGSARGSLRGQWIRETGWVWRLWVWRLWVWRLWVGGGA